MGSNLKKFRSLKLNIKITSVTAIVALGFVGTYLLNNFLKEIYSSRKFKLENIIEKSLNKKVDLGDYGGIRFFGISLSNPNIIDKENINSEIKAKSVYIGIMPIRSFFNQKWVFKIKPQKAEIKINEDFFKGYNSSKRGEKANRAKINYNLKFNLDKYSSLKLHNLGVNTKVKGEIIYKSNNRGIIGNIKSNFYGNGLLKMKLNTNLKKDFYKVEVFSKGLNFKDIKYNIGERNFVAKEGNIKSNFKFYKSSKQTSCKGGFSINKLILKTSALSENLNSESINFICENNTLKANTENLNYGTLTSVFNINIPLNKTINDIDLIGSIGFLNSLNPDIKLSGNVSYWVDKRGINFGDINSNFNLNRTQLSNLNIFRSNRIRGFVTAKGELKGNLFDPEILINFNIDYPHYKGIRIREIWEGEINNKNDEYLLNMKNRYSPIPSFLSVVLEPDFNLKNVIFSRIFNSNKGSFEVVKDNNNYKWIANNFPLDELEFSSRDNQFDRISGIINGSGIISPDQSFLDGRVAWSLGEYRNIKFANSLFDFNYENKSFYVNSSLYPIDGGMIEAEFESNNINLFNVKFNNISTSWSILTAVDIFNFDNKKVLPNGNSKVLNDLQINKDDMKFNERIKYINEFINKNVVLEDKFKLKKYLKKFDSRYNAQLSIEGNNPQNYKLKTNLDGYFYLSDSRKREEFSVDIEGGLLQGKGNLEINNLPLQAFNIFLEKQKDFQGGLDINLSYDLDKRSFASNISSEFSSVNNNQIFFDKGSINYSNSIFDIDFSLLLNNSITPINFEGSIPIKKEDKLDLRLIGNGKFIELIDILSEDYFTFKEGDVNIRMIVKGTINQPILNGFIVIKDSEIELYSNVIKDINSLIIFDFDYLEIKNLNASSDDSGNIFINGSLPFYSNDEFSEKVINIKTNKFNFATDNIDFLVDSNIKISGSFKQPVLGGNLSLNEGFINFNSSKKDKIKNNKIKNNGEKNDKKNWPELQWDKNKNIEIISNETILNSVFLGETLPNYLENLSFKKLKLKLGPDFKVQYSEIAKAYLDTKLDLIINGNVGEDLNARGLIYLRKGRANLYTTPFKLDKNKENYILFASRSGVVPFINFSLISKVPDSIIPISENRQDTNFLNDLNVDAYSNGFGAFGIGNTRLIKIEASYEGFLDQLSFEDENKRIQLRSTPSYSRSQIIGLIGGNSANLINRAFISQFNSADAFSERFQLSLYPALIENNDSLNNVFLNDNIDIDTEEGLDSNDGLSSQAWVAEIGLDISDTINFAVQTIPNRDDLPPLGILTFQANPNLELLGSFDSNGDWKSEVQLFFRY